MSSAATRSLVESRARRLRASGYGVVVGDYDHAGGSVSARWRLHAALTVQPCDSSIAGLVAELVAIDPEVLGPEDRLARLRLADRVAGWAQAAAAAALADYAGAESSDVHGELHRRLEVRIARGSSDSAAAADIASARMLAGVAAPVRDLWSTGQVSYRHVAAVLDRAAGLDHHVAAEAVAAVAPRLAGMPSTRVRGELSRAIARIDPDAAAVKARHARLHQVGVAFRSLPDGLGEVVATLPVEDARAVVERVDSAADAFLDHQRGCPPCAHALPAEIGPARAQVLLEAFGVRGPADPALPTHAAAPGAPGAEGSGTSATSATSGTPGSTRRAGRASRRRGELQVVIDLATLLGLAEHPAMIGGQPIPAQIARELAGSCGSLRRIVTDPVDGHLLDYGTRVYLPQALRAFVAARDGTCRSPGCGQPAARCQLDHVTPFPDGPSSTANGRMACKRDHDLKTRGAITVHADDPDGSTTWRTRHGQRGTTEPRPYLNHPDDDTPPF